jgi:hypothetical protein
MFTVYRQMIFLSKFDAFDFHWFENVGVEKLTLIFDFQHYSASNSPPMHVSKFFLHLFAAHYPGRSWRKLSSVNCNHVIWMSLDTDPC